MSKASLGTKRVCRKCTANFYDLNKDPIECPKCSATYTAADFASKYLKNAADGKEKKEAKKGIVPFEEEEVLIDPADIEEDLLSDDIGLEEADVEGLGLKGEEADSNH